MPAQQQSEQQQIPPEKLLQRKLSDYKTGLSFDDMVQFQVDRHDRKIFAENADYAVDLTYPNSDDYSDFFDTEFIGFVQAPGGDI